MITHNGNFWDPNQPEVKHFGMVEIDEEENIYILKIHGLLKYILPALRNINFHKYISLIHGQIGHRKFISIYNLRVTNALGNLLDVQQSAIDTVIKLSFKFVIHGIKLFTLENRFDTILTTLQFGQQWTTGSRIQKITESNQKI